MATTPHAAAPLVVPIQPAAPEDHAPPAGSDTGSQGRHTPTAVAPAAPAAPGIAAHQPAAVRPGAAAPKPRRRELPPDERAPAPGEAICGSCGAGNAPTRKFCRRCGTDLADAPVVGAPPWWRRIFARGGRAAPAAGTRPQYKPKRSYRWLAWLLGVLVVAAAAVFFTKPYWSGAANSVADRVKGTTIVNPTSFRATSAAKGHGAGAVRDGAPNVYWAPANSAKASGQSVTLGFATPYRLVYLRVFNGASDQLKDYLAESSAQRIEVTVTRAGQARVVKDFTLGDKPGAQDLHLAVSDVTGVQVTILSTYRTAANKLVALGELEFLART